jgi:hypothetical protein
LQPPWELLVYSTNSSCNQVSFPSLCAAAAERGVISARISCCQSEKSRIPIFSGDLIFTSRYLVSRTANTTRSREGSAFVAYVAYFDPEDGSSTFLFYGTTRRHMSYDNILHSHRSEFLKPNKTWTVFILNTIP